MGTSAWINISKKPPKDGQYFVLYAGNSLVYRAFFNTDINEEGEWKDKEGRLVFPISYQPIKKSFV